ncbi:MAG: hypothetical protein H7Z10_11885, partial [Gemmatimonadaceae bacterium]|nr:hypothetical protein [Acetobacteraceae bacterium]
MQAEASLTLSPDRTFIGFIDSVEHGIVRGWAAAAGTPAPVGVELLIDGLPFAEAPANLHRDDLLQAALGTGHHGFRLPIPPDFFDAQPHDVAVRIAGSDHVLRQPGPGAV